MSDSTIAMSEITCRKLQEMAEWSGLSASEILDRAVEEYYGRRFWEAVNAGYDALRADPKAWAEEESERRLWESTLMDGLNPSANES
jgi:predicted transcriptional regulator